MSSATEIVENHAPARMKLPASMSTPSSSAPATSRPTADPGERDRGANDEPDHGGDHTSLRFEGACERTALISRGVALELGEPRADHSQTTTGHRALPATAPSCLVPLPVVLSSFWVASAKREAARVRGAGWLPAQGRGWTLAQRDGRPEAGRGLTEGALAVSEQSSSKNARRAARIPPAGPRCRPCARPRAPARSSWARVRRRRRSG